MRVGGSEEGREMEGEGDRERDMEGGRLSGR